jgi:hypothetical protein
MAAEADAAAVAIVGHLVTLVAAALALTVVLQLTGRQNGLRAALAAPSAAA